MKLPNGYGSVTKLSGKRRNPWCARITIEIDEDGKQIRTALGYFPTRADALKGLADYHNNPYDIDAAKSTLSEIYEKWYEQNITDDSNPNTVRQIKAAYKQLQPIHNSVMKDIKLPQMQSIIINCKNGYQSQRKIKLLLSRLYEFCIDNEILYSNPTHRLKIVAKTNETARKRDAIPEETINQIWANSESTAAQISLMLIYSGVRVSELLDLRKEDVHLEERYFEVNASKTESGIRTVPIAEKVLPYWKHFLETSPCDFALYNSLGKKLNYENFTKHYWKPLMELVGADHVIHETRHTCISLLTEAGVHPTVIKMIVGHKSAMSLTERVYTHLNVKTLIDAINLI